MRDKQADYTVRINKRAEATLWASARGYTVDSEGRVFSPAGRQLNPSVRSSGYLEFSVSWRKRSRKIAVHQFVALQKFGEEALAPGMQVRHLDGDPLNNRDENIAIGTGQDNMLDRPRPARVAHAQLANASRRKLSDEQVEALRAAYVAGAKLSDVANDFGVALSTASYMVNGRTYRS